MFTGGPYETNAYLVDCPGGSLLIDAPEGADKAFQREKIALLFLTHGHFDHVLDAAAIARRHGCPVAMHPATEAMLADRNLLRKYGIDLEVEPVQADLLITEGTGQTLLGGSFDVFEVPGHCPGSICLHDAGTGNLFGGDVLFAGGVGRWDLPGGDRGLLLHGISEKLLPLPDDTAVYPGHGPFTTIGREKRSNPYLLGL
jgi:glyoxylase-like metal-dependent hydrolase (beta-lactamase superfamily II)